MVLVGSLLIVLVTVFLYAGSLGGDFVYDDHKLALEAPAAQSIGAAFQHAFEPYWQFDNVDSTLQRGLWRPATSLLLAFGKTVASGDPAGYHVVSLALHVLASLAVFRFASLLFCTRGFATRKRAEAAALITALVFSVHPAQVESVAWISAVNDPAWGLLGILGLWRYESCALRGHVSWATPVLFLLALTAKENAVVLPLLAMLLDLTARRKVDWLRWASLAVPVLAWYAARVAVFDGLEAGLFRTHGDFSIDAWRQVTLRVELLGGFVRNAVWPTEPAVFRPVRQVLPEGSNAVLVGALFASGLIAAVVIGWIGRRRLIAFGATGFLLCVLPIVFIPENAGLFPLSDRYLYAPIAILALAVFGWLGKLRSGIPLAAVGLLAFPALALGAIQHAPTFEDELAFRAAGVEDAPKNPNVLWGAGNAYLREYLRTKDTDWLVRSYTHHLRSLAAGTVYPAGPHEDESLDPELRMQYLERVVMDTPPELRRPDPTVMVTPSDRLNATIGQIRGNLELALLSGDRDLEFPLDLAKQAARLWKGQPDIAALRSHIHEVRGEFDEAREAIGEALSGAPSDPKYLSQLGDLLMKLGDTTGARTTFKRALERAPENPLLWLKHAEAAFAGGQLEIAKRSARESRARADDQDVSALALLGAIEIRSDRMAEAMKLLDRALEIDPENGPVHKQRGVAFARRNDWGNALESFSEAARLMPEDFDSHYQVAALLLQMEPGQGATEQEYANWFAGVQDVLVRAYLLAPRTGQHQLNLQQQLERLVGGDPDQAFNLAKALQAQNREALALYWLKRVTELGDGWPESKRRTNLAYAHAELGVVYKNLKRTEEAIQALRQAVQLNENHFKAWFELGNVLFRAEDFGGAEAAMKKAKELFPESGVKPAMRPAVEGLIDQTLRVIAARR